ncbi:unnamed protein product [Haemonchus placei]|uniref:Secreted protein n=1 Tax=Haemonchus placei TaxID=6290 RepID=A0A0N4WDB9_HAEPC|nr:unnamed protein product [Haemonchus placei]
MKNTVFLVGCTVGRISWATFCSSSIKHSCCCSLSICASVGAVLAIDGDGGNGSVIMLVRGWFSVFCICIAI